MKKQITQKTYTYTTGLQVLRKYCAYQERSHQEVFQKASTLKFTTYEIQKAICQLIEENFLNQERFANIYAQGKFRTKQWGPQKIKFILQQKGISPILIQESLSQISIQEQKKTMTKLIEKKLPLLKEKNIFIKKQKILRYLLAKGFPTEEAMNTIVAILGEE